MTRLPSVGAFLVVASAFAGCSVGGSGYPGDTQLVVHGEVTSADPPGPKEIVFVWQLGAPPSMDQVDPDFRGGMPQTRTSDPWFTIRIYDYPPPDLPLQRLEDGEVAFARGNLVAIPLGWLPDPIEPAIAAGEVGFGASVGHWIVYLDGPAEAGTLTAWWLGAPSGLGSGYHLVRVEPFACMTEAERTACIEEVLAIASVSDAATAERYCDAPYRLSPVSPWGTSVPVEIGMFSVPPPPDCPAP